MFNGIGSEPGVMLSYCHAHARRKYEGIAKANRKLKKGKRCLAKEAMRYYQRLYTVERTAKDRGLSPKQRKDLRNEHAQPILGEFHEWLSTNYPKTMPKSPIGRAMAYTIKHWNGLNTYLKDGRLELDNNATERDVKPFVIARKNFMFACTQSGADSLGVLFSLIITARHHGLNPYKYMEQVFEQIPNCSNFDDYESLLPWNIEN